jgi:TRAP-type mannitol/chloroaromatic compound transport system permease large subunit
VALVAALVILMLLTGVFTGQLFAVEAAATGGVLLILATVLTRALDWTQWKDLLADALAISGALMALLMGATVFSLVFRLFGTDRWLSELLLASPWPAPVSAVGVLLLVALCAWVLDAFEMIFVVIPMVAPPLIVMLGDAQQAAVLLLLVLQLSFLVPPMGYAVMMARAQLGQTLSAGRMMRALAPYIGAQLLLVVLVFFAPWVVHRLDAPVEAVQHDSVKDIEQTMREMSARDPDGGQEEAVSQTTGPRQ